MRKQQAFTTAIIAGTVIFTTLGSAGAATLNDYYSLAERALAPQGRVGIAGKAKPKPITVNVVDTLRLAPGRKWEITALDANAELTDNKLTMVSSVDLTNPKGNSLRFDFWLDDPSGEYAPLHLGEAVIGSGSNGVTYYGYRSGAGPNERFQDTVLFPKGITIPAKVTPSISKPAPQAAINAVGRNVKVLCSCAVALISTGEVLVGWELNGNDAIGLVGKPGLGLIAVGFDDTIWMVTGVQ